MIVALLILLVYAFASILLGGMFIYFYNIAGVHDRNPLYWALGIAFAGSGGAIISKIIMAVLLPADLLKQIRIARMG